MVDMANINRINKGIWLVITHCFYKCKFGHIGKKSVLFKPMQLDNMKTISISDGVFIAEGAWLMGSKGSNIRTLIIGNGTVIGHFSHIVGLSMVCIENDVLMADRIFISDCTHEYEMIDKPIAKQPIKILKPVTIGEGSWLGENVCVCGASVGKHCVIAANSVVTKDIPDYCVAAGSPAKVVKRYNFETKMWEKV